MHNTDIPKREIIAHIVKKVDINRAGLIER
jgi:hypothetical protein